MKQVLITEVVQGMLPYLDNVQIEELQKVLKHALFGKTITETVQRSETELMNENNQLIGLFIGAKRIEGCSEKSLKYYQITIETMITAVGKDIRQIVTDDLRTYLADYQQNKKSSRVTIDNIRRILSSFFSWLEDEDYILKSPVRRIHKVKTTSSIKETYSDEALELKIFFLSS